MKQLKFILAIITLLGCSLVVKSQQNEKKPPYGIKLRKNIPSSTKKSRMPSNQYLEFIYFSDPGECMFTFSYDIETLSVTIVEVNTNCTYLGEVSQDNPIMYQDLPAGDYHITCITQEGDIYEGEDRIQ